MARLLGKLLWTALAGTLLLALARAPAPEMPTLPQRDLWLAVVVPAAAIGVLWLVLWRQAKNGWDCLCFGPGRTRPNQRRQGR
jgi:hypothetical protein